MASTVVEVRGECALIQRECSGHTEAEMGWKYVLAVEPTGPVDGLDTESRMGRNQG